MAEFSRLNPVVSFRRMERSSVAVPTWLALLTAVLGSFHIRALPSLDAGGFCFSSKQGKTENARSHGGVFHEPDLQCGGRVVQPRFQGLSVRHGGATVEEGLGDEVQLCAQEETGNDPVNEQLVSASFSSSVWFHPALAPQLRTKGKGFFF